jgi:hypothetical protein
MVYNNLCNLGAFVLALTLSPLAAQDNTNGTSTAGPSDQEVRQMIETALEKGLPEDSTDRVAVLAMRHSAIAVPLLLEHVENFRPETTTSKEGIKRVADILAYVGDNVAVDAVIHLADSDPARFGYLVARLLDYAWGRRNPYSMAYQIVARSHSPTVAEVTIWVQRTAGSRASYRAWASAIADQNKGRTPEEALSADILVRMLPRGVPEDMNTEVRAAFAASAARSPER